MLNKLFIVLATLFITGCSFIKEKPVYIVKHEYVTYELPKGLTTRCKPIKPMDVNKYMSLTKDERETYLTNYTIMLLGELKKCDSKVQSIESYISKYNTLVKEGNIINEREKRDSKVIKTTK